VAQFVYLLLTNRKIREVITTVTSKSVLILGRFTEERKAVLNAIRESLRKRRLIPILFDWEPSPNRDLTETVQLLAGMSRFIVADVTDARSIPQELSAIIPNLPSVPVRPLVLASQRAYAMFEHWRRYPSVLPEHPYESQDQLVAEFDEVVMQPLEKWEREKDKAKVKEEAYLAQIEELRRRLNKNEAAD
jgi:hypothetical protein